MTGSFIRVLIAEDYPQFRRFLVSALQKRPEFQIVSEVDDGSHAVLKAQELQPELILLDIGLPTLNGIEAAKQIRRLSPHSKILFISQESSPELIQVALQAGAQGYVLKIDAGVDLNPAIDAVLREQNYLSRSIARRESDEVSPLPPPKRGNVTAAPSAAHHHKVGFYSDDQSLMNAYIAFVGAALKSANAVIVVATEAFREKLTLRLQSFGLNMRAVIEQGRYIALDNAETLAHYMVDAMPDPVKFFSASDELLAKAADSVNGDRTRIFACGECAPSLWEQGNIDAAVRIEQLWDGLAKSYGIHIFCGYSLSSFHGKDGYRAFTRICAEHSAVHPR